MPIKVKGLAAVVTENPAASRVEQLRDHVEACRLPRRGVERALVRMAEGITIYARFLVSESTDGPVFDGVLVPAVGEMLHGFVMLLNGPRGRLDGGWCSEWATLTAEAVGWDLDAMTVAED